MRPLYPAFSWARVHVEALVPVNVSYLVQEDDANQSGVSALSMTGAWSGGEMERGVILPRSQNLYMFVPGILPIEL